MFYIYKNQRYLLNYDLKIVFFELKSICLENSNLNSFCV